LVILQRHYKILGSTIKIGKLCLQILILEVFESLSELRPLRRNYIAIVLSVCRQLEQYSLNSTKQACVAVQLQAFK
jgi:hypothetical protein